MFSKISFLERGKAGYGVGVTHKPGGRQVLGKFLPLRGCSKAVCDVAFLAAFKKMGEEASF